MRDEMIVISPFKFIDYLEITGHQCFGEHGLFRITGHINSENEQEYLNLIMSETWVQVDIATYEGTRKHMFKGIILDADIERKGSICVLTLSLITGSYLMDNQYHIRSFQDKATSYSTVLDTIIKEYTNGQYNLTTGKGEMLSGFLLQYNETDWTFIKRLASHLRTDIFPDSVYAGVKIHFGEPRMAIQAEVNMNEYAIVKNAKGLLGYQVKLREVFHVGDWIRFNGMTLWIMQMDTELVGNELYHIYYLVPQGEVKIVKKNNEKCIGASLTGKVIGIEKDKVQVVLEKDENKDKSGRRWFSYATPYSSPDGTGWYCMPEEGDKVRLRLPSENENDAYVISSVHMESANGAERKNPSYKSIMNKQGKEILLTPKSLIMTNNAGMSIEILDNEGIKIISDKNITMEAADTIEITSANSKLELYAKDNLLLKQGNTQMNMNGEMRLYGARLNLN